MKFVWLVLFSVLVNSASASVDSCISFYNQTSKRLNFVDQQRSELVAKSNLLKQTLHKPEADRVFDFVGVGAGPTMGSFTAAVKNKFGHLKTLVVEATNSFGTFDRVGNFKSNSIDYEGFRSNVVNGSPVQPFHFDPDQGAFIQAKAIGDATVSMYSYSGTNLLLSTKIVNVSEASDGQVWPARYKIDFADGTFVFAKKIGIGSGLGKEIVNLGPVGRQTYRDERESAKNENRISKLRTMEEVLERSKSVPMEKDFKNDESIVIVGGSDGAAIALEGLAGFGNLSKSAVSVKDVTMIGSSVAKVPRFKKILNLFRYWKNENLAGIRFDFSRQQGRVVDVVRLDDGRFELKIESEQGLKFKIADHVIFASGYAKSPLDVLYGLSSDTLETQPVMNANSSIIAQKVISNGREHDIYVFGVAGSDKTKDAQDVAKVGIFGSYLRLHGERAKELASRLWDASISKHRKLEFGPIKRMRLSANAGTTIKANSESERRIYLSLEFGKILSQFRIDGGSRLVFRILPNLDIEFLENGLSNSAASQFYKAFQASSALASLLAAGDGAISVTIPADGDGYFIMEKLRLK